MEHPEGRQHDEGDQPGAEAQQAPDDPSGDVGEPPDPSALGPDVPEELEDRGDV